MELILFIIGCILSYLSGVFVYAFIAGLVSGILLLREAKKKENSKEHIEDYEEIKDN